VQAFAERIGDDQFIELCRQLRVPAKSEICLDPVLERGQPHLAESFHHRPHELEVSQIGKHRTPPRAQSRGQLARSLRKLSSGEQGPAPPDARLELH
jgi:hypothetical protein